jgi:hypothetical protein
MSKIIEMIDRRLTQLKAMQAIAIKGLAIDSLLIRYEAQIEELESLKLEYNCWNKYN